VTREVSIAVIQRGEFKTVDEVVFAKPGDRTIKGFNATVDARRKKLVAVGPVPAAILFNLKSSI